MENAFKHGVSTISPSHIQISIQQQDSQLRVAVSNTIVNEMKLTLEDRGIGLTNTRRRLDLLYPDKYSLVVNEQAPDNEYQIHLTLHLA